MELLPREWQSCSQEYCKHQYQQLRARAPQLAAAGQTSLAGTVSDEQRRRTMVVCEVLRGDHSEGKYHFLKATLIKVFWNKESKDCGGR